MDFASILSSEISKKRGVSSTSDPTDSNAKKYLKRSELEAQRQTEYLREQAERDAERARKAAEKRVAEEAELARREAIREKQRSLRQKDEDRRKEDAQRQEEKELEMTDEEAVARLRATGEPARLFGETIRGRIRRLKRIEARESGSREQSQTPAPLSLSEEEMRVDLADIKGSDVEKINKVYRQLDAWFRLVIREWKIALDERPSAIKESIQGRNAADAMRQADEYMKPLFTHFRNKSLRGEVFAKVCEIVHEAQNRRYVKANDVYLRLSIGNAAWPIGVTMVGIHERSAREKLHEHQKEGGAHIMSDEVTRKFLQSIKRCLSFCQTRWPPEDPLEIMG